MLLPRKREIDERFKIQVEREREKIKGREGLVCGENKDEIIFP